MKLVHWERYVRVHIYREMATYSSQSHPQEDQRTLCIPFQPISSKGMWLQHNPLDFPYPLMMAQIVLIVVTSGGLYSFLRPLGQTKFVCNLLAGIIWGPSVLGQQQAIKDKLLYGGKEFPLFDTIAHVGVVYSFFLTAVKIDLSMLRRTAKNTWKIGLSGLIISWAVSLTIRPLANNIQGMKQGGFFWFYASFSFSSTYLSVIAQALEELNLMTSELGQIAMSCGLLNDVIAWSVMAFSFILRVQITSQIFGAVLAYLSLIGFIVFVVRPVIQWIANTISTTDGQEVKECYVVGIQLFVLVMAFISDAIGTKPAIGAIILGLVIPNGPPLGATIVHKTEFLVSEFLMPVFFFRVGFHLDVYSIRNWISFTKLEILLIVTYMAKVIGITAAGLFCKIRFKNSLMLGMIMSIKGIVELITYNRWKTTKVIDEQCFAQIVLSALALTMMATSLVHFSYKLQLPVRPSIVRNLQSVSSDSEMLRILCCVHKEESVHNIIALLEVSNPTEASPICAYIIRAVELVGRLEPHLVPLKKQRNTFMPTTSPSYHMLQALENYSKNSKGPVIIQASTMIAPYKSMHETICRLAIDKLIPLIIIPFHENHHRMFGPTAKTAALRQFNVNLQSYSPCTVGILVDRGLSLGKSSANINVGVFFIGGPDDREMLAYAARMSGNPKVVMRVFRFTLITKGTEEEDEKLDEALVDEFKLRNTGNHRLDWSDIEVEDGEQVMDGISKLQGNYDLVMVGRRHKAMSVRDEEMADFMENAELGVLGDMLASSDFCAGMVNVLVMQESLALGAGDFHSASVKPKLLGCYSFVY